MNYADIAKKNNDVIQPKIKSSIEPKAKNQSGTSKYSIVLLLKIPF